MTAVLVLPAIDPDVTGECVATIHRSVLDRLVLIDNSRTGITVPDPAHRLRPDCNLGVGRSWNAAVRWAAALGHTAVVLVSAQVRFGAAGARDLLDLADRVTVPTMPAPTHWHTAIFPLDVFDVVGVFDENFYPGYYEDIDMLRRCLIADILFDEPGPIDAVGVRDGHGVDQLRADHPGQPTINYDALADYWHAKWSVTIDEAADLTVGYLTPFGVPDAPVSHWEPASVFALRRRYGITG